jgi:photosystem II stability/assembly factor-like uncharacterized protein
MKWKKLADGILQPWINTYPVPPAPEFGAIEVKDSVVLAAWGNFVLSTDGGKSWTQLSIPYVGDYITDIAIYDDHTFAIAAGYDVIYSSDQGNTWLRSGVTNSRAIHFDDSPDRVISSGYEYIDLIQFNGSTTTVMLTTYLNDIQQGADNSFYVKGGNANLNIIYRSTDHGTTWITFAQNMPGNFDCWSFICDRNDPKRIVVINEDWALRGIHFSEIHMSSDGGVTWSTTLKKPLGIYTYLTGNATQGGNDYFVGTASEGILRSSDKGLTWASIGGPPTPVDSRAIAAKDDCIIYAIDTLGSIWTTGPGNEPIILGDSLFANALPSVCDTAITRELVFIEGRCTNKLVNRLDLIGSDSLLYEIVDSLSGPNHYPDSIGIKFTPQHTGRINANLKVTFEDGSVIFLDLGTQVSPKGTLSFAQNDLASVLIDTIGGDAVLRIVSHHSGASTDAEFTIHYDTSALVYQGVFDEQGNDHTISHPDGSSARIAMNTVNDSVLFAKFSFFPVDSNCTKVLIDSITEAAGKNQCLDILTTSLSAEICSPSGCGRDDIARFMRYGIMPKFSVVPNPSLGFVSVSSNMDIPQAELEIRNEAGAACYSLRSDMKRSMPLSLGLSSLPPGMYVLVVKGYGAGVPFIIVK